MGELDIRQLTDEELTQLRSDVQAETERRVLLATVEQQVDDLSSRWAEAIGREDGDEWVQPLGAHDAYRLNAVVTHLSRRWESLIPANVWEPGVSGWRELTVDGGPPAWVQPTGAHDAYNTGDRVFFQGEVYESTRDENVWSPSILPAGWKLIP